MAGIDNNTVLYLRGDSFTDLSPFNNSVSSFGVVVKKGDGLLNTYLDFQNTNTSKYLTLDGFKFNANLDFTIDFMFSPNSLTSSMHAIISSNGNGSVWTSISNAWQLGLDNGTIYFTNSVANTSHIFKSTKSLTINTFYHIQLTRKENYMYLFIDGKLDKKVDVSNYSFNSGVYCIGRSDIRGFGCDAKLSNIRISNIYRHTEDFTPPSKLYSSININVINKDFAKVDFNISKLGQETINKIEILVNNVLSKTYANIGDLTYNIDKSLLFNGNNKIKIKVTFDNDYSEEKEIDYEYVINNLPTSSNLKELIDRQELLTNSIEVQKNTLKSILESKNVVVSDSENKLSILIQKVGELGEIILPLYLYKDGDECVNLTGGWVLNTVATSSYGKIQLEKNEAYIKLITPSGSTSGTTSRGFVITSNYINVTNYNKLKFEVLANINGTQTHDRLIFEIKNSSGTSLTKKAYKSYTNERTTEILDLSTITGNVTVQVYLDDDGTSSNPKHYIEIYKIWLEE